MLWDIGRCVVHIGLPGFIAFSEIGATRVSVSRGTLRRTATTLATSTSVQEALVMVTIVMVLAVPTCNHYSLIVLDD